MRIPVALLVLTLGSLAPAMAQSNSTSPSSSQSPLPSANSSQGNSGSTIRDRLVKNLKQSGFTNIQVQPESFLVRAKDKDGDPVMMVINPDSVSEVVDSNVGRSSSEGASMQKNSSSPSGSTTQGSGGTRSQPQ